MPFTQRNQDDALAPATSPRPKARPNALTGILRTLGFEAQQEALAPKSSPRPMARPERAQNSPQVEVDDKKLEPMVKAILALIPEDYRDRAAEHVPGILRQCVASGMTNVDQVAYILATADHETKFGQEKYKRSESLVEDRNGIKKKGSNYTGRVHTNGKTVSAPTHDGAVTDYWDSAYGGRLENRKDTRDARNYRGRGYVQLTGRRNYRVMTEHLKKEGFTYEFDGKTWGTTENPIDLQAHPEHVNQVPELAARILVEGSTEGMFTGVALDDHINEKETDFKDARKVINGTDQAAHIATLAKKYAAACAQHWPTVMSEDPRKVGPQ